jgi:uncharacterized BrkB/YihY/UPF0761 family membrane protein
MNASGGEFTFGVAAVIWFASGGIASMITALNLAYQMEETRSWFKIRSTAIVLTLVMSALLVMALLLVLVSGDVFDSIGERLRLEPVVVELGKILQWPTAIVFVMLSVSLIYYTGPTLMGRRWLCLPKIPFCGFHQCTLLHCAQNLPQYQFARDTSPPAKEAAKYSEVEPDEAHHGQDL